MLHIDRYLEGGGYYKSEDGTQYESAESFLEIEVLGFCGCGCPDLALEFVLGGLAIIERFKDSDEPHDISWPRMQEEEREHFGEGGARWFFWYWADEKGFLEHGGSVPGWLTPKGREVLHDLRALVASWNEAESLSPEEQP